MKFLDFFSGIGTIRIGMEQAGHECVGHVEWDKYAQASYMAMHDVKESEFIGWDIRGVRANELPRANAWWFGAPCQDFSIAGKRKGLEGDRSSLVREIFRLVRETEEADRPEWLLYENVKGMLSSNGGRDFLGILLEMDELGYDIQWQTLNSKDWGVPQNRERVFTIGHSRRFGRREILPIGGSDEESSVGINVLGKTNPARATSANVYGIDGIMGSLMSRDYKQPKTIVVPCISPDRINKHQNGRRFKKDGDPMFTLTAQDRHGVAILKQTRTEYGKEVRKQYESGEIEESRHNMTKLEPRKDGITNTITTVQKDNYLLVREATSQGFAIAQPGDSINLEQPNSKTRRGRVGKGIANTLTTSCNQATIIPNKLNFIGGITENPDWLDDGKQYSRNFKQGSRVYDSEGIATSLSAQGVGGTGGHTGLYKTGIQIRKLTPKECFRLQGIPDDYFDKARAVNSDSQLYKQAGNACTVNVIYEIAKRLEEIEG